MKLSFLQALSLALIILKLCHVINISWWLILLPMYMGILLVIIFALAAISIAASLVVIGAAVTALDYYLTGR